MDVPALVANVVTLARQAGDKILEIYEQEDLGVVNKADHSPLTLADLAAHQIIVEGLTNLTPAWPILSEESKTIPYHERQSWQHFWLVDPLDGTKEFIQRNGEFTVNIALINDGIPMLGVVYAPVLGIAYGAAQDWGAFRYRGEQEPERIQVRTYQPGSVLQVVASRSHAGPETEEFLQRLESQGLEVEVVSRGSSLKFCLVAEGQADLYPRFGPTMVWDTAAAQCVVEQAGGSVTTLAGERLTYDREALLNPYFVAAGSFPWQDYR